MDDNVFVLTNDESEIIRESMSDLKYDSLGSTKYLNRLKRRLYNSFPKRIVDLLNNQKSSFEPLPYFVIKNFPIDKVSGSPNFNETGTDYKDGCLSENIVTACASTIGEPYSVFLKVES